MLPKLTKIYNIKNPREVKSDIQYKISQFPDGQQTKDEENAGLLQTVTLWVTNN